MSKVQVERLVRLIKEGDVTGADDLYRLLERLIPDLNNSLKKSTKVLGALKASTQPDNVGFLLRKTENLHNALLNFVHAGDRNTSVKEKKAFFLSQIDFWDAQVSGLIQDYSILDLRYQDAESWDRLSERLRVIGLDLSTSAEDYLKWALRWKGGIRTRFEDDQLGSLVDLNRLIVDWNQIVKSASKLLRTGREDFVESYTKGCL